ncbi:MAG: hypothetical protein IJ567_01700 [Lachnospiraceae bacterium]|nr:hypothetical protein [Lachnospiraceae bacterium]
MKKVKLFTLILLLTAFTAGCAAESSADSGGIPTQEQLQSATSQLSTEPEDMEFSLNGEIFQYPIDIDTLLDAGWTIDKSILSQIKVIPGHTTTTKIPLKKKKDSEYAAGECYFTVTNNIDMDVEIGHLATDTLEFDESNHITLILPQGITWDSTFEDVLDAYQPAEDHYTDLDNYLEIIISNLDNNTHMQMTFDLETRKLSHIKFY